jgi:hypothetical protein
MWWSLRILWECPHCGHIQDEDGSSFYDVERFHGMKCEQCNFVSVFPMLKKGERMEYPGAIGT